MYLDIVLRGSTEACTALGLSDMTKPALYNFGKIIITDACEGDLNEETQYCYFQNGFQRYAMHSPKVCALLGTVTVILQCVMK